MSKLNILTVGICLLFTGMLPVEASEQLSKDELQNLVSSSSSFSIDLSSFNRCGSKNATISPDFSLFASDSCNGSPGKASVNDDGKLCLEFSASNWSGGNQCNFLVRTDKANSFEYKNVGKIQFQPR